MTYNNENSSRNVPRKHLLVGGKQRGPGNGYVPFYTRKNCKRDVASRGSDVI